jgi:hypothetical protein
MTKPEYEGRPQLMARRKPEALAPVEDMRLDELQTLHDRLVDIEKTETSGRQRYFEIGGELLAGGAIGAWLTGASLFPPIFVLVAAAVCFFASVSIKEAHADSIRSFRRDFRRLTESYDLVEAIEGEEASLEAEQG